MTRAHAFIQSDLRNIAIADVSNLDFGNRNYFLKNKTAAFAFKQRIDIVYRLSYVI
jgi:hypothetical protein